MAIIISIFILISCFKRPMLGLALLLQTNIIRSLISIDYQNPCFNCTNEPDVFLGAVTPILGLFFIILRFQLIKPVKYVVDSFDLFFLVTVFTLFFTSLYAVDTLESLGYSFRFLIFGFGFFFVSKLVIINTNNFTEYFKSFLLYSLWLSIIFGTFGAILYLAKGFGQGFYRLTMPGVHPIPYSQLIGLGIFISFILFITNGTYFNIKSKLKLNINKAVLPYLVLLLLATQTRGVILSMAVAIFIYLLLNQVKIKKRLLYISGVIMGLGLILAVQYIDFEVLFERLLAKKTEKSVDDRFIAYTDSFNIFLEHPFGIGPDSFKHFSVLPYPHNLFLEFLAQYGVFGLVLSLYFIVLIIFMCFIVKKIGKKSITHIVMLALFFYYFTEAMFSFTLWMQRGMFISMGLFVAYNYRFRLDKNQNKKNVYNNQN